MKPVTFKNLMNNELFICENVREVHDIDGVEYIVVHKQHNDRKFLMRRDVLEKVDKKILKTA